MNYSAAFFPYHPDNCAENNAVECDNTVSNLHGFEWHGTHPRFWTRLCRHFSARCKVRP